ncbi:MAG TPA: hypothetical protein VLI93_08565, partial [Acetobacteraceae bacterium]|nr:hypothetical protein [Acetobacteraceae bacterium]
LIVAALNLLVALIRLIDDLFRHFRSIELVRGGPEGTGAHKRYALQRLQASCSLTEQVSDIKKRRVVKRSYQTVTSHQPAPELTPAARITCV